MNKFGIRLKFLRKCSNLTQTELAKILFLDPSTIAKYEKGLINPSIEIIKNIASFFKVKVHYLLGYE